MQITGLINLRMKSVYFLFLFERRKKSGNIQRTDHSILHLLLN